jgi:hypothetical protein
MPARRSGSSKKRGSARKATREKPVAAVPEPASDRATGRASAKNSETASPTPRLDAAQRAADRGSRATRRAAGAAATAAKDASRNVVAATPTIVLKAASIIEEEVAIGLGALKRVEQRFLDVDALRAQQPDRVMSRFRKDAHEAVDIILDIVTAAATTVGERAGKVVNVTASHRRDDIDGTVQRMQRDAGSADAGTTRLPTVRMAGVIAPGADAELVVSLENESDSATAEFTLHSSELVSASGARIPSSAVMFHPATLAVGPRSAGRVSLRVRVPADAKPGSYESLLRATQLDGLRAMLAVTVG